MSQIDLPQGLSLNGKNMMRALASILQFDTTGHDMETWVKKEVGTYLFRETSFVFIEEHSWRLRYALHVHSWRS